VGRAFVARESLDEDAEDAKADGDAEEVTAVRPRAESGRARRISHSGAGPGASPLATADPAAGGDKDGTVVLNGGTVPTGALLDLIQADVHLALEAIVDAGMRATPTAHRERERQTNRQTDMSVHTYTRAVDVLLAHLFVCARKAIWWPMRG
jgi:hypothetical protein